MKKILCAVLVYFDYDIIKKSINSIIGLSDKIDFVIIENHSDYTESLIKPYFFDLLKKGKIHKYFCFEKNISNKAMEIILDSKEINLYDYEYVVLTDGDLQCSSNDWLDEVLKILNKAPDAFCCAVDLDISNLPEKTFPDARSWIPEPIKKSNDYLEAQTGVHFLTFKTKELLEFLRYRKNNNMKFIFTTMHDFCYKIFKKKWYKTVQNKAYHLTWDSFADLDHPYTKERLSKDFNQTWNHNKVSRYAIFTYDKPSPATSSVDSTSISVPQGVEDLMNLWKTPLKKEDFQIAKPQIQAEDKTQDIPQIFRENQHNYYCPLCQCHITNFLPLAEFYNQLLIKHGFRYSLDDFETLNHKQYTCPVCESSDRDRLYAMYLKLVAQNIPLGKKIHLLDFSPTNPFIRYVNFLNAFEHRTVDFLSDKFHDIVDVTNMSNYNNDLFDGFVCSHILEHVEDDSKAFRELYRVLKPGGWGILMVPICTMISEIYENPTIKSDEDRWKHFGQNDHVRLYSKQGFISRAKSAGFKIYELGKEFFGADTFQKTGITQGSILYVVEK